MNIRELLEFHTRFKVRGSFFDQYVRAVKDKHLPFGVVREVDIVITETHKKLIEQAHQQNILHKDVGHVRALRLADDVYYYDVGLRAIDGRIFSRGTSLNLDEAVARAFGELYERVSMRFVPENKEVVYASYKALQEKGEAVLPIHKLPQATVKQKETFPDLQWNENSVFGWIETKNIYTSMPAWVPAQLLHWGYKRQNGEPLLGEMNTNGLGAGYSYDAAVLSGASELLQRHYFFTYWYAAKAPPKILVQSVLQSSVAHSDVKKILHATHGYGFDVNVLDCTLAGGTPSVAVIITKPGLGWFLGMATKLRYDEAIERALCEALSVYTWVMDGANDPQGFLFSNPTLLKGFCDKSVTDVKRIHAWSQPEVAKNGEFFLKGKEVLFDDVAKNQAASPVDVLEAITGGHVYAQEAKQSYLNEVGFHSVRVVAPRLYKLALHERFATPVLDGVEPKNTYPHPFP